MPSRRPLAAGPALAALLAAASLPAGPLAAGAFAQGAPAAGAPAAGASAPAVPAPEPTLKDRLDKAVSTITGSPMADLDLDMKRVLDELKKLDPKPIEGLSPQEARRQPSPADAVAALVKEQGAAAAPAPAVTTKDITYPAATGPQPARVYTPAGANGPLPVVVYYHGGGFVIADIDTYDATPRALAALANAVVVSTEYRHAPENKLPAAHEDAFAAYKWAVANAASIGGDPARVALVGESAGGNLAVNTAIQARDQGAPKPVYVVAVYPMAGIDQTTGSYRENANAKPLNKAMMAWFYQAIVHNQGDREDPRLNLVDRANLKDLPPTTIVTAQIDPLHDDGKALADKMKSVGGTVNYLEYPGVTHEFFGMGRVVAKAREAELAVATDLRKAFAGEATGSLGKLTEVRDHMEVRGSDGAHVGTVDKIEGRAIKLTKDDKESGDTHHMIPGEWVASVGDAVTLNRTADQARAEWQTGPAPGERGK